MPNADFFATMGFFVVRGFLDPSACARLRGEVRAATHAPATVRTDESTYDIDRSTRSTDLADVTPESRTFVDRRLADVMPRVAAHYGFTLTGCERVQFLVYREGDFFRPHRDRADDEDAGSFSRQRRVAAVIFLNGEGGPSDAQSFQGGALTFYGLFDRDDAEALGFPLESEEGLLVTFPTDVTHEVRPVEGGERNTVVTWFVGD